MQALETIKVILRPITSNTEEETYSPSMTVFAAFDTPQWRTFRLRPRKPDCIACGNSPSISADTIRNDDYAALCQRLKPLEITDRISVKVCHVA
jgi:adenylyltransferase and sulfurtransferase